MTGGDVESRDLGRLLCEEERHHPCDGHGPDGQTSEGSPSQRAPGEGLDGIHHSQEPVDAYDRHEHDGGVHVAVKRCSGKAAHFRPEFPVAARKVIADLKGQQGHEQHVCCGQVQHIHHSWLLDLHFQDEHSDGHDVQGKADDEHAGVNRGDEEGQPGAGQVARGIFRDEHGGGF